MTAEKISITMDPEVVARARRAAARADMTFSAWMTRAAHRAVFAEGIDADLALLDRLGYADDGGAEEQAVDRELAAERQQGAA